MTITAMILKMSEGLGRTFSIFALTLVFSLPLGLIIALLRMSKIKPIRYIAQVYISIMRGTPLMLQLLVVAYGPFYLFGFSVARNKLIPIIIAFSLNYAAYYAEIYRGGIEAMPVGQYEAAAVLGYSKMQTFMRIILPQVVKHILPSITNEVITLVKDTSLVRVIAVYEIMWNGQSFIKSSGIIWPLFFTGVYYLLFVGVLTLLFNYIERRLSYFR